MGLGITVWFPVGQSRDNSRERYEAYFRQIPSVVPNWEPSNFFGKDGFRVTLVPFEEEVYGSWEDGGLRIEAKTNSAGPGYHAYLVDLLDELSVAPTEIEDETGYYSNRDFRSLQNEMGDWLKGLSKHLLEMPNDCTNLAISLPVDFCVPDSSEHFTRCPLGYFDRKFFERSQSGEPVGPEFFLWWNQPQDALFFRNVALRLIWCKINWLSPQTEEEHKIIAATLDCLEQAYTLESCLDYPAAEWIELAQLTGNKSLVQTLYSRYGDSKKACLGYQRGNVRQNVCGWSFARSGRMHSDYEEDGGLVLWDDNRTIRLSSISAQLNEDIANKSEYLLHSITENDKDCESFSLCNPKIAACVQHSQIEENGEPLYQTRLVAALDEQLLIMSLYYVDMADRDWAIDVCASVTR
ncbi:MAG: hypothetical protein FWE95_11020 [Planctomycetaceae bacterium]|nr:hypothetical protein [Planctomycetaceae bacterium]